MEIGAEGQALQGGLTQSSSHPTLAKMSSFCYSGQCITACGQWPCPLPQSNNSEILHPTPLSSINSSRMYIQFKIPLLVRNPPRTPAVYPTSFCSHFSLFKITFLFYFATGTCCFSVLPFEASLSKSPSWYSST